MGDEIWVLFFIMYIGVVWITILHKLQQLEKLFTDRLGTSKDKGDSPS